MTDRRVQLPDFGDTRIQFFGESKILHDIFEEEGEFDRQKGTPHLGLIKTRVECATHTRYQYLMSLCAATQLLSNIYKGDPELALGSITVDGQEIYGSDLLRCWYLLSNYGHLKNTIADERALIRICLKNNNVKRYLIRGLEGDLRQWANDVINEFRYEDLHYVIASKRILINRALTEEDKARFLGLIRILVVDGASGRVSDLSKLSHLKKLHRKIRALTILSVDSIFSHVPVNFNLSAAIFALAETEQYHIKKSINDSIFPLLGWLYDEMYLDKEVLALVRSYEEHAVLAFSGGPIAPSSLLSLACSVGVLEGVSSAKYSVWDSSGYSSFCRIPLLKKTPRYIANQDFSRRFSSGLDLMVNVEDHPHRESRYLDLIIPSGGLTDQFYASLVFSIASYLDVMFEHYASQRLKRTKKVLSVARKRLSGQGVDARPIVKGLAGLSSALFNEEVRAITNGPMLQSVRSLFWAIMERIFDTRKYKFVLEPHLGEIMTYGLIARPKGAVVRHRDTANPLLKRLIKKEADADRRHEFELLSKYVNTTSDDYVFVCCSGLTVLDREESPNRMKQCQIDGVIIRINEVRTKVELYEAKNTKESVTKRGERAAKQIREKTVPALRIDRPVYNIDKRLDLGGARISLVFK